MNTSQLIIKRAVDLLLSFIGLLVLSPLIVIILVLVYLEDRSNPFFLQKRIGRSGIIFKIIKIRTMIPNAENIGTGIKTSMNDARITKLGAFLRNNSIDELLQFVNVLKGDMSLIGPRPAPVAHLSKYSNEDRIRLLMRPGITGWAQVNGRNTIPWSKRIELDIWYVKNYSLVLDLKIVIATIDSIINKKGIYSGKK